MCIAAFVWQAHPVYQLLLLLNRDELYSRPTKAVAWWGEGKMNILGGKDELAGGTWMGCTRDGRVAFVTNVLEPISDPASKTRGELPVKFLQSKKSPLEFAEEVAKQADEFNGFNLIIADLQSKSMAYLSNRPKGDRPSIQVVNPGMHVLTNAKLDTPWPKAQCLVQSFKKLLLKHGEEEVSAKEMVEKLMCDKTKPDRERLPDTGCDSDVVYNLSSIFVEYVGKRGRYGTRSSIALSVKREDEVGLYEKYLECGTWKEHTFHYHVEKDH